MSALPTMYSQSCCPGVGRTKQKRWLHGVQAGQPDRHAEHMLSNWANSDYDTALILTAVTGNVSSPYATHLREFIQEYSTATGQISCVPLT